LTSKVASKKRVSGGTVIRLRIQFKDIVEAVCPVMAGGSFPASRKGLRKVKGYALIDKARNKHRKRTGC
jgi:hypothetical protein